MLKLFLLSLIFIIIGNLMVKEALANSQHKPSPGIIKPNFKNRYYLLKDPKEEANTNKKYYLIQDKSTHDNVNDKGWNLQLSNQDKTLEKNKN